MPCYRPVTGFKPPDGGPLSFHERKDHREVQISCGQCIGCRIRRAESWAVRCMAESYLHSQNWFITWTYDNENIPPHGSLRYPDVQNLHKRMRKALGPFRFFLAGEYGEKSLRPHYHGLYFGLSLPDAVPTRRVSSPSPYLQSETLAKLWGNGAHVIGACNFTTAAYTASYCLKKSTNTESDYYLERYGRTDLSTGEFVCVEPEFAAMSRRPGLGAGWLEKYHPQVYEGHHAVAMNGSKKAVPRYFDKLMETWNPDALAYSKLKREDYGKRNYRENTASRLAVREEVAQRTQSFFKEAKTNAL